MHFSNVLFAAASLASVAVAQTATAAPDSGTKGKPNMITDFGIDVLSVQAGQKYTVHWTNTQGPAVTLSLRSGDPNNLSDPITLCSSVDNTGSCTFTIPKSVASGNKNTIEICEGSDTASCNYSPMFTVGGGTGSAVTASGDSATATATGESTETGEPTATGTATGAATQAETVTGTATEKRTTLATEASASATEESTPTETESAEATSSQTGGAAPAPNEGSVARSSSLAMALCVMVAVVFLN